MSAKAKRARRRRWPWIVLLACLLSIAGATLAARALFSGERLARLVVDRVFEGRIRGRVEIASIDWPLAALPTLLVGGDLPLVVRGIKVYEAAAVGGELVIDVPEASLTIDSGKLMAGARELVFDDVVIRRGTAVIAQIDRYEPGAEPGDHDVSLLDAFQGRIEPRIRAGVTVGRPIVFDLPRYALEHIRLELRYPAWSAVVEDVAARGSLRFDGNDPLAGRLEYDLAPAAPRGTLAIPRAGAAPLEFRLVDVRVPVLRRRDVAGGDARLEYEATARTVEGAELAVDGELLDGDRDLGDQHAITLSLAKAGGLAGRLTNGVAGGAALGAVFRLVGSEYALTYRLGVSDLALALPLDDGRPPVPLAVDRIAATWNDALNRGRLEDTVVRGAGGEVRIAADVVRSPLAAELALDVVRPLDLAPYLPPDVVRMIGGDLDGRLRARASIGGQAIDRLDLRLGRARIRGGLHRDPAGVIHSDGFEVAVGGTTIRPIRGRVDGRSGALALDLGVVSRDLDRWLRRLRQPPLARTLRGQLHLEGPPSALAARGQLTVGGVPIVGSVAAGLRLADGVLRLGGVRASALGGELSADGEVVLGDRPRLRDVTLRGAALDLARLPGVGELVRGVVELEARAGGALRAPRAEGRATIAGLALAGEPYRDARIAIAADGEGTTTIAGALEREAGGALTVDASVGPRGALGGVVDLRELPIDAVLALLGVRGRAGGRLDAAVTLSGTTAAPTADGTIAIARGWFGDVFLGAIGVSLERVGPGAVRVRGGLLQGRVEFDGTIATAAPFAAEVALRLKRVELDLFLPGLATRHGARGWISGEIAYRGELARPRSPRAELRAHLSEAVVVLDADAAGERGAMRLENRGPIDAAIAGGELTLAHPIVLRGPTGEFSLAGSASADALALRLRGTIAMALLRPYVRSYFDRVSGQVAVDVALGGTLASPVLAGTAEIDGIAMQPTGQDTTVRIPAGKIELAGDQVSVTGLSMLVTDEFSAERSELRIAGGVRLDGLTPARWALRVDGALDGKMLLVVAPQAFSAAYGSAELSIALLGQGRQPDIDGTLEFSPRSPLTIVPRGARREIALTAGVVRFTDKVIEIGDLEGTQGDVQGTVDDEGQIERIEGEISLEAWRPVDVDLTIDASGLPLRIPQELEMNVNLRGLRVVGGAQAGLDISGTLEVIDGRYVRKFDWTNQVKPQRTSTPSTPFWDSNPLIGNARLDLKLVSQAFFVDNNLAKLSMSGRLDVGGTPRALRFDGVIRVDDGTFKFPSVRPTFERATGSLSFEPLLRFPEQTPTIDFRAESNYTDTTGQAHLIHLALRGTLSALEPDLYTEAGLNRSQTLQLLFAGRTPEEIRRALGDTAIGSGPGQFADASAARSGYEVADQLVKDLSSDVFGLLIGDSLREVLSVDVVRLQVGTNALGVRVEKRFFPNLRVLGDLESSLTGWLLGATAEWKLDDTFSIEGKVQQKQYDDETLEDETNGRAQVTWRRVLLP